MRTGQKTPFFKKGNLIYAKLMRMFINRLFRFL